MVNIVKRMVRLIVNTVVVVACIGFFAFIYIMALLGELGPNKPRLTVQ